MTTVLNHRSSDELVLQWRVRSDPGVPEGEWGDTTWVEPREHGSTQEQADRMLADWRRHYPDEDEEQRVVVRITHVTDYAVTDEGLTGSQESPRLLT